MHIRVALIFLFLVPCVLSWGQTHDTFQVRDGFLNATNWNFGAKKLPLNGRWVYFDHQLLSPERSRTKSGITRLLPLAWNDANPSGEGTGFSTYTLDVLVPSSYPQLALELPQMYCSYYVWLNGDRIATAGRPGTTPEDTTPQWLTQVVTFKNPGDTLHLTLQIANFHHHIGGIREPIYLGTAERLNKDRSLAIYSSLAEVAFLFLETVLFLVIFLFGRRKPVVAYFALLCLSWAVRAAFSNIYLVTVFYPAFDWAWQVRIEYMALFLSTLFGVVFLDQLFKNVSNQVIKYLLVGANLFFLAFSLFSSPPVFTRWLTVYLTVSLLTLVYGVVIVIRAVLQEQKGVWYLVFSILLGILIFGYDLFSYKGVFAYNPPIMNVGYIVMFLLVTISLLVHLDIIKSRQKSVLTYDDLYSDKNKKG